MGSRAKLADVPKVHQMIEERIRASIASRFAEYRIMLPGIRVLGGTGKVGRGLGVGGKAREGEDGDDGAPEGMTRKTVDIYVEK